jgi:uncharacterized membrane protein YphA (DoxX/SURF4 family)
MFRRQAGVVISGLMLVAGGASVALGLKPKLGSAALIAFLAGASPTMHDFWRAEDPGQRMAVLINFSKNLALLGAARRALLFHAPPQIGSAGSSLVSRLKLV